MCKTSAADNLQPRRSFARDDRAGAKRHSPHRQSDLGARAGHGRRAGQRQARRQQCHDDRGDQRAGHLQLPGGQARTRPLQHRDPRRRLQARRSQSGRCHGGRRDHRRHHAGQDQRAGQSALQRRMAQQPARRRQAQSRADQLRRLPHHPAHRAIDPRRRRVHAGVQAHGHLFAGLDADPSAIAAARRQQFGPLADAGTDPAEDGRLSGQRESEQRRDDGIPVQAVPAADRPLHPRHHHRIRSAAQRRAAP